MWHTIRVSLFWQQFFLSIPIFSEYFAQNLAIVLIIKMFFFLVYLQLLSMHDCCIRVIHNMVAALSLDIFLWAYVDLILFMTILFEYFYLCNANRLSHNSQTAIFPNFTFPQNLFFAFSLVFSQNFLGKVGTALHTIKGCCFKQKMCFNYFLSFS